MTVELYHFEPNANGGKPLIALFEKGVAFESRWVDLLNWEQHQPPYLAINPKGQVPALVHDGTTITESTIMGEYIDEVFIGPSLRPGDAAGRERMRRWSRFGDEFLGPSLSMIAWSQFIAPMMKQRPQAELKKALEGVPTAERRSAWSKTIHNDFHPEELEESRRRLEASIVRLEQQLARTEWLVGTQYTLADINLFNMAAPLPIFCPLEANIERTPHLLSWITRMRERPAVVQALAYSRDSLRTL
ncbi:hypothetical protein ASE85_10975 [Sphingobium sp. Leaf26]|uniref:glutathione S-transferase family protein n=1 Tax=Sphingobium sp. Leaf26 TaxID=1735693 RepID=UPI0006FB85DF|nr:glutathione S-transferase family protein [Sphingobium sp. Leaf26]KQM99231.1 hypothetical protein ASE85_10975 [Sphingobium sp. Leaf26]